MSVVAAGCSDDPSDAANDPAAANATIVTTATTAAPVVQPVGDIVGTALENGVFTQLAGMVVDAGLVDALRAEGPMTVFAPTDSAFPDELKPVLDFLYQPENKPAFQGVLTYHVVPGKLEMSDLKDGELATVQGEPLTISHEGTKLLVNGGEVVAGPVEATNGNVYAINQVLVPPSMADAVAGLLTSAPAGTTAATTAGTTG